MEVIVMNVSKLVYNLLPGITTYILIYKGYNPFTKYHGHPRRYDGIVILDNKYTLSTMCVLKRQKQR